MADRYDFSNLGVMVVDNNPFWSRLLRNMLGCMRIEMVRTYDNAVTAWKDLQTWTPDLIFVDLSGEEIDSLRFIRGLRRHDNPARCCPIVLLSNVADAVTVKRARNAGADYTLAKPFSLRVIYRAMLALRNEERAFVQTTTYYGPDRRRKDRAFVGDDRRVSAPQEEAPQRAAG